MAGTCMLIHPGSSLQMVIRFLVADNAKLTGEGKHSLTESSEQSERG